MTYSLDAGRTWKDTTVPNNFVRGDQVNRAPREYYQASGDTSVDWDSKGNVYLSCQMFKRGRATAGDVDQSNGLYVFRSTQNDGASFNFPARPVTENNNTAGNFLPLADKQFMAVDHASERCGAATTVTSPRTTARRSPEPPRTRTSCRRPTASRGRRRATSSGSGSASPTRASSRRPTTTASTATTRRRATRTSLSSASAPYATWNVVRVTNSSMPVPTQFPDAGGYSTFYGDYAGLAVDTQAHPVWSDTRNPDLFACPTSTGDIATPPAVCGARNDDGTQFNDQDAYAANVGVSAR